MNFLQIHKFIIKLKKLFYILIFSTILGAPSTVVFAQKSYTVVLDAGHGGKDPGNLGNGFKEKDIALKVVQIVGKNLEKHSDINVIYTRNEDIFIDLWKRGDIANTAKADLFVSIHCDSHTSNAYGAGTFVLGLRGNKKNLEIAKRENAVILLEDNYREKYVGFDPNSAESVIGLSLLQEENLDKSLEIASIIQNNFTNDLKRLDRKVKQDNFQVLRETIMPSVLIELGFLTNRNEGAFLDSYSGQHQMGSSIAAAIESFIDHLKLNTVKASNGTRTISKEVKATIENNVGIEYKVQIASGKSLISTEAYNFKGLRDVQRIEVGRFYKYYYGISTKYRDVLESLKEAKQKGYTSAFIVAFKNGEKISVTEANKMD
ncbi:N-acetylmuramoyl-L-alanine amidase [Polaribacter glomeratus]|uniref:N-acetylmuramoyl-L-alanine amidase n=1 Tax=Polaribacter glomeratus TaxID=102 RepID=A0A2S7WWR6_9FLAO|nr:N-acetylmuramoyl-L-alanine amidase [Polaribacter glomeratus]PQJ82044.1 N-acetylmuramoyl-L-alanine amidase [Polaribacter glomeratus]TXD66637.1 N-acetylmuramoyl-L-alanine amidase [Polaribacter glomeratus]